MIPTIPHRAAGWRIDPPVSVPRETGASHATGLTNVFRDDEPAPCLTPEQALSGAPAVELQRFKVPRILVEE